MGSVEVRARIADVDEERSAPGVVCRRHPDGAPSAQIGIREAPGVDRGPGLASRLTRGGDGVEAPELLAGACVAGGDEIARTEFRTGDAEDEDVVSLRLASTWEVASGDEKRRLGEAIALLVLDDSHRAGCLRIAELRVGLSGRGVDRPESGVERRDEDSRLETTSGSSDVAERDPTAGSRAAELERLGELGGKMPDRHARCRVQGDHSAERRRDEHDGIDLEQAGVSPANDERCHLKRSAWHPRVRNFERPSDLEGAHVGGCQLIELGVALVVEAPAVRRPIPRGRAALAGNQCRAGQAPEERDRDGPTSHDFPARHARAP